MKVKTPKTAERRQRVSLESVVETCDPVSGEVSRVFGYLASRWSSVEHVRSKESDDFGGVHLEVTHRFKFHYAPTLKASARIVMENRVFEIVKLHDVEERGRFHVAEATEVTT